MFLPSRVSIIPRRRLGRRHYLLKNEIDLKYIFVRPMSFMGWVKSLRGTRWGWWSKWINHGLAAQISWCQMKRARIKSPTSPIINVPDFQLYRTLSNHANEGTYQTPPEQNPTMQTPSFLNLLFLLSFLVQVKIIHKAPTILRW